MGAADLTIAADSPFARNVYWYKPDGVTPQDWTGWSTAKAEIRRYPGAEDLVVAFTIVVDKTASKITLSLTAAQTAALPRKALSWDLVVLDLAGKPGPRLVPPSTVTVQEVVTVVTP
jgi:hypothetical protein